MSDAVQANVTPTPTPTPDPAPTAGSVGAAASPSTSPAEAAAAPSIPEPVKAPEPAKVPEAAAPDTKTPESAPPPSLLAEPESKPAPSDAKAPDAKADSPAPKELPPEALVPSFQPFKVPEGLTFDNERMGQFTDTLGSGLAGVLAARAQGDPEALAKADQEFGQKLMDLHIAEMTRFNERQAQLADANWNKLKQDWQSEVIADPELGGDRLEDTKKYAMKFIGKFAGTAAQQKQLVTLLQNAALSENQYLIRAFANAGKALIKEVAKPVPPGAPPPVPKSRSERRYNGMKAPAA